MTAIIFNGKTRAQQRQAILQRHVARLAEPPTIASVFFEEDKGSVLYTRLKKAAAQRAGMQFTEHIFKIANSNLAGALAKLNQLSKNPAITGIIVQKPTQAAWQSAYSGSATFGIWWKKLVIAIPPNKDIDGLTPTCLDNIKRGQWTVLPATVKAVLIALEAALGLSNLTRPQLQPKLARLSCAIIGCSDIIGLPLADAMRHLGADVTLICDNVSQDQPQNADIIISATGQPNVITGNMVKGNVIVIDVGAPKADIDFASVAPKASFITPVPGGIGPLTVISLLENTLEMSSVKQIQ